MSADRTKPRRTAESPRTQRRAVMVMGAPRSGTSAISNVIARLGVDFGDPARFIDTERNRHNPIFFELEALNALNSEIIRAHGYEYTDFDLLRAIEPSTEALKDHVDACGDLLRQEFGDAPLIGLKDPRFCFTAPVWWRAFAALGFSVVNVLCLREEAEIIRSNREVNGWSEARNRRIVRLSYGAAATVLRSREVVLADYDATVSDPLAAVAALAHELGLSVELAAAASTVIDPKLRHTVGEVRRREAVGAGLLSATAAGHARLMASLADAAIDELVDWRRYELSEARQVVAAVRGELDAVRQEGATRALESVIVATLKDMGARLDQRDVVGDAYGALKLAHERRIADLESAVFERDALLRDASERITSAESSLREAQARAENAEAAAVAARAELAAKDARGCELEEVLAGIRSEHRRVLDELEAALAGIRSEHHRVLDELADARADAIATTYKANVLERRHVEDAIAFSAERAALQAEIAAMKTELASAMSTITTLKQELDRAQPVWRRLFEGRGRSGTTRS